jgi:lysophospholipase L1-like esterase
MRIILKETQLSKIINFLLESDSRKLNVLFVGDSLSAGPNWTWNYLLEKSHPNWDTTHLTKGAKRTSWMLDVLKNELNNKKYDLVFIYGGTNDMFSLVSTGEALGNIQKMVDIVVAQGGTPYVFEGYDVDSVTSEKKLKPTKYCDKSCMLKGRNKMIDFQKQLSSISNAIIIPSVVGDESWTSDGIHPSSSKHQIMKSHVENYIGKTTPSTKIDKVFDTLSSENIQLIHKILQILGYSKPEWGISNTESPEFIYSLNNFRFDQGLSRKGNVTSDDINLLKDLLVDRQIDSSDLNKVITTKTENLDSTSKDTTSMSGTKFENFAIDKHGNKFLEKVKEVGKNVGLDYKIILATMYFESKMNPSAQNPMSKATGLIQFMPFTAKSLGTSVDSLKNMSAIQQLKYVEQFYNKHKNLIPQITSPEEAYLLVFYPAAVGKPDSYVLGNTNRKKAIIAKQNKPFDSNNDKEITKGEILNYIRGKWGI